MPRKTVPIASLKDYANDSLAYAGSALIATAEYRQGIIDMIELALHSSGNYRGFRYLEKRELLEGVMPGIHVDEKGNPLEGDGRFLETDHTRRKYF